MSQRYQIAGGPGGPFGNGSTPIVTQGHTVGTQSKALRAGKSNPRTKFTAKKRTKMSRGRSVSR